MNTNFRDSSQPLVSVITVVKNSEKTIEETILSVLNQSYKNIEYLIIDGGSTDSTIPIIKKYQKSVSKFISEDDAGIYHAMNKGASLANGVFISFLNADDIYFSSTIQTLFENYLFKEFDYTFGPVNIEDVNRNLVKTSYPIKQIPTSFKKPILMPAPHLSVFVKREIFNQLKGFDESYLLSSDYDFLLRLIKKSNNVFYFSKPVGTFRLGGRSGSFNTHIENFFVFRNHKFSIIFSILHTCKLLFKEVIKKIFC
jgi:glycosyltransferase involved in cell wall biosynthesis